MSQPQNRVSEPAAGGGTKAFYGVLGLLLLGYAVSLVVRANGASTTLIDGWGTSTYELVASALVMIRAAVSPRDRRFCLALGIGMALWAIGDFAQTYEDVHNANAPTPDLANYLWVGFFPVTYVGVMLLMRQEVRKFTAANYLDGVVATLTCAAAFAAFAFGAIRHAVGDDSVTVAWNLIYPVGDILLLILTLAAAAMVPPGRRMRWYLMAAASLANAIGDVCALFDNSLDATHFGYFWDSLAWPLSLFLFSLSVWVQSGRRDESELEETSS